MCGGGGGGGKGGGQGGGAESMDAGVRWGGRREVRGVWKGSGTDKAVEAT